MMAFVTFLVGVVVGYFLAKYTAKKNSTDAANAEIIVGVISKKEK